MFDFSRSLYFIFFVGLTLLLLTIVLSPLEFDVASVGRFGGVVCMSIAGGLYVKGRRSPVKRVVSGTRLVSPKRFQALVSGDGIGIPYEKSSALSRGTSKHYMRVRRSDHNCHIMVVGDTGTGKTSLQHEFIRQIRSQTDDAAIIYDPVGEFWKLHGDPHKDILLYPFDENSPYWDINGEIENYSDALALAKSFIPDRNGGANAFWDIAPRKLLAFLFYELKKQDLTVGDLCKWLGDPELLNEMVAGTELEVLISRQAPAQRSGVLAGLAIILDSLKLLPPADGRRSFSFRKWAKEDRNGQIFIMTSASRERVALKPVISALLDTAFISLMDSTDYKRDCWVFLDELPSLQRLPSIETSLYESRKFGVSFCLGFQGRSQLEAHYGKSAEAIMSASTTKIFLRTSEYKAAEWISNNIGRPELKKKSKTFNSTTLGRVRDSVSTREDVNTNYLVIPNEIQIMKKLSAYLVYDGLAVNFNFSYPDKGDKKLGSSS